MNTMINFIPEILSICFKTDIFYVSTIIAILIYAFSMGVLNNYNVNTYTYTQCLMEEIYFFIDSLVIQSIGLNRCPIIKALSWSISFTSFMWIAVMNIMDIVPSFLAPGIELVPTTNINLCLGLSFAVFCFLIGISIFSTGGLDKFLVYKLSHPFNKNFFIANIAFNFIEMIVQPVSLGVRLFFNMFTGQIIKHMLSSNILLVHASIGLVWSIFHMCIGLFQAFIFIALISSYIKNVL